MSNLITQDRKIILRRIFYTRLALIFLSWALLALSLTFAGFFAIFAFSKNELRWQEESLLSLKEIVKSYSDKDRQESANTLLQVADTVTKKKELSISEALSYLLSLLSSVEVSPKRITISSPEENEGTQLNEMRIYISAVSKDKEQITYLLKAIKSSDKLSGLNVTNLVSTLKQDKSGNVHFEFNLNYHK